MSRTLQCAVNTNTSPPLPRLHFICTFTLCHFNDVLVVQMIPALQCDAVRTSIHLLPLPRAI